MENSTGRQLWILERLPRELRLEVYDLLDYQDAIRLSQVNKYFSETINPQKWPVEVKESFVYQAQYWKKHNEAFQNWREGRAFFQLITDEYACFSCFRVKPKEAFSRNQTERKNNKLGKRYKHVGHTRFCVDCGIRGGIYRPSEMISTSKVLRCRKRGQYFDCDEDIRDLIVCAHCSVPSGYDYLEILIDCTSCSVSGDPQPAPTTRNWVRFQCENCKGVQGSRYNNKSCDECNDFVCQGCRDMVVQAGLYCGKEVCQERKVAKQFERSGLAKMKDMGRIQELRDMAVECDVIEEIGEGIGGVLGCLSLGDD